MRLYIPCGKLKHGDLIPGRVGRYCAICERIHGYLFMCEHYPDEIKKQIVKMDRAKKFEGMSIAILIIFLCMLAFMSRPQ